ncbi:MAG: neutral/alkaline non-lysosomal ceramidase N-terminal domain-containing protein [Sedimentisphaerales bacterium]|nr:neutral/alkaline non-lysosomal ceramidase N-terminal domain-containing protein [Sedimentisphaerales bacterium]
MGVRLIGSYGKPSDAVLDELSVRAMVLDDGRTPVAIVSADLLYTPLEEITCPVRNLVQEKCDIPPQNVLLCATHTHSGPEVFSRSKLPPPEATPLNDMEQAYLQTLISRIVDAVVQANQNKEPARIGTAKGRIPEIVFNRRTLDPNEMAVMTWRVSAEVAGTRSIETNSKGSISVSFALPSEGPVVHFGPIDPELCVLRVENMEGEIIGSIINFGCHPVCIYPYLPTAISADYPGDATDLVEKMEGGVCLFTLAPAGNLVPYQRGVEAHKQIGKALGAEALRRLQFVTTTDKIALQVKTKTIRFPVKQAPVDPKAPEANQSEPKPPAGECLSTEIQVIRLGTIYLLGLPGEILVEIGLEIKQRAGIENLFIISLGNDAIGYVCPRLAYQQGGYEPGTATHLAEGAGEIMVREALGLLYQIQ